MKNNLHYWLMKSEPDAFSVDDLAANPDSPWDGVRNYQARNFMRQMALKDLVFFYHSSCKTPGIVGVAEVTKTAYPDPTSWDPDSPYFDPKSSPENPRWIMVNLTLIEKWPTTLTLSQLKAQPSLADFQLLKKGSRLSVMPVEKAYSQQIFALKAQLTS